MFPSSRIVSCAASFVMVSRQYCIGSERNNSSGMAVVFAAHCHRDHDLLVNP